MKKTGISIARSFKKKNTSGSNGNSYQIIRDGTSGLLGSCI